MVVEGEQAVSPRLGAGTQPAPFRHVHQPGQGPARASASPASTTRPDSSCTLTQSVPVPRLVLTTGSPLAIASAIDSPNASARDTEGRTAASWIP